MVDQSFSVKNFRKIFDYENRKGVYLEDRFFPKVRKQTHEIKKLTQQIRDAKKNRPISEEKLKQEIKKIGNKRDAYRKKKETILEEELEKIATTLSNNINIDIDKVDVGQKKIAYACNQSAEIYFALKQVQRNMKKLYGIKQANRHEIIHQIRQILSDNFPKCIIKTDISSFYESIPQKKILQKLNEDLLLSTSSMKVIRTILHKYSDMQENDTDADAGLPRGIGISAYLAEFYMRSFDDIIKNRFHLLTQSNNKLIYYARYVDDIVIIYTPSSRSSMKNVLLSIKKEIEKMELNINLGKTKIWQMAGKNPCMEKLEFLGYSFSVNKGNAELKISKSKNKKYNKKIYLAFKTYEKEKIKGVRNAESDLIDRMKFLTGNTRLVNNKKDILTGSYFSNSLLTDTEAESLQNLDTYLKHKIYQVQEKRMRRKLFKYAFVTGFKEKKFYQFSANRIKEIVSIWKYVS